MAKKPISKNKKSKKPEVGNSVFLIGEKKHIEMLFRKVEIKNGEEYAYCTWFIPNMNNRDLDDCRLDWFPVRSLTLQRPPSTDGMFRL